MRKGIGIGCVVLGVMCLLMAVGFVVSNSREAQNAEMASQTLLEELRGKMEGAAQYEPGQPEYTAEEVPAESLTVPREMATVPAGDYDSIGILSIPVLELELPVLTDWSYAKLKKAPCHYYGSCYEPNFVIAAHNYPSHFGRLSQLQPGDLIVFTNAVGEIYCYEVVLLETLLPSATEEMITSGFDLSLYTCTPGGSNRVTVRCRGVNG